MSIQILHTGVSQPDNTKGYIEHATVAAKACLAKADVGTDEIDLLINVGNYRDDNMCEPSIAVLIQHALGINLNPLTHPVKAHTFSFDLMNGACGLLNALQVANAILSTKDGHYALLVSGDAHPSGQEHADFPIQHASAAILLERSDKNGFSTFSFQTTQSFEGRTGFLDLDVHGIESRHSIITEGAIDPAISIDFAHNVVSDYISQHGINPETTELLIAHPDDSFQAGLSSKLQMNLNMASSNTTGDTHTAQLGFALDRLQNADTAKDVICIVVGSGITVGCALYRGER